MTVLLRDHILTILHHDFQTYQEEQKQPFSWIILLLGFQIFIGVIILIVWSIQLVDRGRKLAKKSNVNEENLSVSRRIVKCSAQTDQDNDDIQASALLYRLAKDFLIAKLNYNDHDSDKMEQKRLLLRKHLNSEYGKMKTQCGTNAQARQYMMKRIRCTLIKHPYDRIGRQMASETKIIFQRHILGQFMLFNMLMDYIRIPTIFKKTKWTQKAIILTPFIIATFGTIVKGTVYCYDLYSDIQVIKELESNYQTFKMPTTSNMTNITTKLQNFLLKEVQNYSITTILEPCEVLDLIEQIPNYRVPFYRKVVINYANIHWNPNRNSQFDLSDIANITSKLYKIYNSARESHSLNEFWKEGMTKPSDFLNIIFPIIIKRLKQVKSTLEKQDTWWARTFAGFDANKYKPIVHESIKILEKINKEIFKSKFVEEVVKRADMKYKDEEEYIASAYESIQKLIKELSNEILENLNPHQMEKFEFKPSFDPFKQKFNSSQLNCRKYIKKLFEVGENEILKNAALSYYTHEKSENTINHVTKGATDKLRFLSVSMIKSAWYFLILTISWTLVSGAKDILVDFYTSQNMPIITNFKLECNENNSNSSLFDKGNINNDYVAQSAKRHALSIQEATGETLSAITVQIALWIYMSTFLSRVHFMFKESFQFEISNEMFGFSEEDFTDFSSSAICNSLIAAIISLTFAQYKHYMTKHQMDLELAGKLIYFLACITNSLAIILTQTSFFSIGLPFFTSILLVIIRYIANLDNYDSMVDTHEVMTVILVFIVVLMPLKSIPKGFAILVEHITDKWILHHTYHLNQGNRSGYEMPGINEALFMFLPSAKNKYSQINDRESTGCRSYNGFHYFSKDPLSKQLYHLKFEMHIFRKVIMHMFYLTASFILLNSMHLILKESTVGDLTINFWLEVLVNNPQNKYNYILSKVECEVS